MNLDEITSEKIKQYKKSNQKENLLDRPVIIDEKIEYEIIEASSLNGEAAVINIDLNDM